MRVGVSMWSYYPHYQQGKMDVLSFLDAVKAIGADGVELLEFFWKDKEAELPKALEKARALGLEIGSYAISNDLSHPDEAERAAQLQSIRDGVDTAVRLGTDRLRVFAGHHNEVGFEKAQGWIIEGLKAAAAYAEQKGVVMCLENHGTMAGRGEQVKHIIDAVGSPALQANPDTGNFMTVNQDPTEAVAIVAPFTGNVHFKDFRRARPDETEHVYEGLHGARVVGTAIGEGDVDLPKIVQILGDAGYNGFLTIEYEGVEDPATAMPRSVAFARKVAAAWATEPAKPAEPAGRPGRHMIAEIHEQPEAVARALAGNADAVKRVAREVRARGLRFAVIAARGTSAHAGVYAKYLLETTIGLPVSLAAPSVYTLYRARPNLKDALVIGVSQSGQGPDVVEAIRSAKEQGAYTVAVTNNPDSLLAGAANEVLLLQAGPEISVAATKTYTTSLAVLAQLVAALADDASLHAEIERVPDQIRAVLDLGGAIRQAAERYTFIEKCLVVARGLNHATALETGLKLAETCYLLTHAYSGADIEHGPIAVVDHNFPCILYNVEGPTHEQMLNLAAKLESRGAECLMISADAASLQACRHGIRIPSGTPERVSPLVNIVAGQLFACNLALHRAADPDTPRGLKKVTQTI